MAPSSADLSKNEHGGGELGPPINSSSSPPGGSGKKPAHDKDGLNNIEQVAGEPDAGGAPQAETGDGDPSGANWRSKVGLGGLTRNQRIFIWKNRRGVLGGGIVATIMGLVILLSTFSGPLQFLSFGKLMEQFHMTSASNTQNDRFLKEVRFWRFASKGEIEKSRLSFLGNKVGNYYEGKLNVSGLSSAYTDTWGLLDGYVIDDRTPGSPFEQKSSPANKEAYKQQVKQKVAEIYGQDTADRVKWGSEIKGSTTAAKDRLMIDTSNLKFFKSQLLTFRLLKTVDVNGLSSIIGTRTLAKRAALSLGPLNDILTKVKRAQEAKRQSKLTPKEYEQITTQERVGEVTVGGQDPVPPTESANHTTGKDGNPTPEARTAQALSDNANSGAVQPVQEANQGLKEGNPNALADTGAKLFKTGAGVAGATAIGIACIAQSIDNRGSEIKTNEVRLPLIRQGFRILSIMSEIQKGTPVDPNVLANEGKLLSGNTLVGKDAKGNPIYKKTSWFDAASIQAGLGAHKAGVAADSTLQNLNDNTTPFHITNQEPLKTTLNVVCNPVGGFVLTVVSFLGGDVVGPSLQFLVSKIVDPLVEQAFVAWASGQGIDPNVAGAVLGNHANYGMKLAENDQNASLGGTVLSTQHAQELQNFNLAYYQNQFNSQNVLHKLFSPTDPRSAIAGVINHSSSSVAANTASLFGSLFHFGHMFSSLGNLFSHHALAASGGGYDYGVPSVGFSQEELSNPQFENPYKNADQAAAILDPSNPNSQHYIDLAKTCFNVNLTQENGSWGVQTYSGITDIASEGYKNANCGDTSDPNWPIIRFFILDTETMNSMACYAGDGSDPDIEQACTDIGFNSASSSNNTPASNPGSGSGSADSGTNAQLAQTLLNYRQSGKFQCQGGGLAGCDDLQAIAGGQSLAGKGNCLAKTLDPRILQTLLYIIENGNFKIGTTAICVNHPPTGTGGHSGGLAVDIGLINGVAVNQNTPQAKSYTLSLDKFLTTSLPSSLTINQLITYGYGNHYDADIADQQLYNGTYCHSQCVSIYTPGTEAQHENHVHVGF